ncbi:MAG: SGNH/GDSL hydrolase family protein, partial [Clostridia bacterium]|nr:SGNH/GDSL hydrolase family protein [Clostridia bacterium]
GAASGYSELWLKQYNFPQDCWAVIVAKGDDNGNLTAKYAQYAYFFHTFTPEDSPWRGKLWYSFGTSMSDIGANGAAGNNGSLGKWPLVVDELSGMTRVNRAIGSGGIFPGASHGGNVKQNILACPFDVDLVTLESGLNDWGSAPLGEIGDRSDATYIGNFTQCVEHLTQNTRAKVVLVTMVAATFERDGTHRSPFFKNGYGHTYRDYLEAQIQICHMFGVDVIDAMARALNDGRKTHETIVDTVHFTDLGGQIYGRYIWEQLRRIPPYPPLGQ